MDRPALKPPFAYYGGKTTLGPVIADLLPAHKHYVEPFAGSLAVLLAKEPSGWETVNDLDGHLVNFWRVLRNRPDDLIRAAKLTPHSRDEYVYATQHFEDEPDDLERARQVWTILTQGRSNRLAGWGWRVRQNPAMDTSMPSYVTAYANRMEAAAERLKNVSIENRDAVEVIEEYGRHEGVCIYADPPYLGSTRGGSYRLEMKEDALHIRLAEALNACKASVVLSGYASPLYADLFDGWYRTELKAPTALSGRAAENEVLWSNVPLGAQQLDLFGGGAA